MMLKLITALTSDQRNSAAYAMDYIRSYNRVNRKLPFLPQHELNESLLFQLASSVPPYAHFIVPSLQDS